MIDAHQHCWQIGCHDCTWPTPELAAIYRDFGPGDWLEQASPEGVSHSVLVQSQPSDRDTDYLLRLADTHPHIVAVVGWVDLVSPRAPERIAQLATHAKLRGLRPMLQNLAEADWILRPELAPAMAAMQEADLAFDALVTPRHLPHLLRFAQRFPGLSVVIDHAAKPFIARGEQSPWREQILALAALPNVFCKYSGLLTEAAPGQGTEQLQPYVDVLWQSFGPRRLMWGSDWPVLNLAGGYRTWLAQARAMVSNGSEAELAEVFSGSARRFYRLS